MYCILLIEYIVADFIKRTILGRYTQVS